MIKIIGTGRKLPERSVSNDELAAMVDTSDEWITSRTGIKNRFVCTKESLTDLAEGAARIALEKANLSPQEIEMIICPTIAGDFSFPSLACCLAQRLNVKCPAFDINAACSGFIYGLEIAESLISKYKNILIVGADMMSRLIDWNDRASCVLFGDGAGACVVTSGGALKYIRNNADANPEMLFAKSRTGNSPFTNEESDGGFAAMQGQDVYKFAVTAVGEEINLALAKLNLSAADIDYFVLHQANSRIIDGVRTRLKQPPEKFPMNIDKYANTTAATIPILLDEMIDEEKVKTGNTLMMVGFGAGMTTGTCVMVWE
ncbi:MAG: ketoacyl-ACP synthase III [Defluviitaleaceae bacterium]|nr:ketoacyl-ACP synthase III [Defluviitaleaceae bacterium]